MGTPAVSPLVVAVLPTETTLCTLDVRTTAVVTVQIDNTDASQQLRGFIYRRANSAMPWTASPLADLGTIEPLTSGCVDIDCEGNSDIQVTGYMTGAGGSVKVCVRDKPR